MIRERAAKKCADPAEAAAAAIYAYNRALIDAARGIMPAVKPQSAYYELLGHAGVEALQKTVAYAKSKGLYVIVDGKRNDIGSTAECYSAAFLGRVKVGDTEIAPFDADALTVNPYLGSDCIKPFLEDIKAYGKAIFVLGRTSNRSSGELQLLPAPDRPLYRAVAELTDAGARIEDEVVHRHRRAVTPDSVATVIYTSGTTGRPKGCVITHANFMFEADTMAARWKPVFRSKPGDEAATLLFLPLAHVFGRMVEVAAVRGRVKLGHQPELSAKALMPDLVSFRPTFVLAVPYIFEKVFHAARRGAEAEGRAGPFDKAVDVAVAYAEAMEDRAFGTGPGPSAGLRVQHQFFDKVVYRKVREAMGGRIRHAMSGGSGMERRLGLFFAGAGVTVYEGYGLTESTAAATANPPERPRYGTVGQPVPGTTVHIAEDGEVWLHGAHVFAGYLGDPAATAAVLRDGWLATGDLGLLDEDGYLTITGRKKEILVTSGGKSVSPGGLEERVRTHPLVAQCIVVGNDRPYVAALVTVDPEAVEHWLAMRGRAPLRPEEFVRDSGLEKEVRRAVVAANTAVSQAESIRTFRILARPFTEEQGLLTPSLKLRRRAIERTYATEIDALYR